MTPLDPKTRKTATVVVAVAVLAMVPVFVLSAGFLLPPDLSAPGAGIASPTPTTATGTSPGYSGRDLYQPLTGDGAPSRPLSGRGALLLAEQEREYEAGAPTPTSIPSPSPKPTATPTPAPTATLAPKPTTAPVRTAVAVRKVSFALDVPCYRQADPLWASVRMGNGSSTIAGDGCLVTSLAMAESFRTKTSITPDLMVRSLSFSATGYLLRWPANFAFASTSGYLRQLYHILNDLKRPVLVGGRSPNSTHWVLVRGFKDVPLDGKGQPTSLASAMFLIDDPASSARTTLRQFFSAYPKLEYLRYATN